MLKPVHWTAIVGSLALSAMVASTGCTGRETARSDKSREVRAAVPQMRMVIIDDSFLGAPTARQWSAQMGVPLDVVDTTVAELMKNNFVDIKSADVVIFPTGLLGELASRKLLQPIPVARMDTPEYNRNEVLELDRNVLVRWGQDVMAASLGNACLVMLYRSDVFDKLNLDPPTTWSQYQEVVHRLAQAGQTDLAMPTAVVEPLGPGWAGLTWLARAAPYIRLRGRFSSLFNVDSMEPLVAAEPFRRALDELKTAAGDGQQRLSPKQVLAELVNGRAAMAVSWPAGPWLGESDDLALDAIRIAPLPGADHQWDFDAQQWRPKPSTAGNGAPLIGAAGRLVGVGSETRHLNAAIDLVAWLTSKTTSGLIAPSSPATAMFRASQLGTPDRWAGDQWSSQASNQYADVIRGVHENGVWMLAPRLPHRDQYLEILDLAVGEVLDGGDVERAAATAAARLDQLNQRLGMESQKKAYRLSEGMPN